MKRMNIFILLGLVALAVDSGADTMSTSITTPEVFDSWVETVDFEMFDPAVGNLHGIQVILEGHFHSTFEFTYNSWATTYVRGWAFWRMGMDYGDAINDSLFVLHRTIYVEGSIYHYHHPTLEGSSTARDTFVVPEDDWNMFTGSGTIQLSIGSAFDSTWWWAPYYVHSCEINGRSYAIITVTYNYDSTIRSRKSSWGATKAAYR